MNPDKAIYHNAYIVPGFSGGAVLNEHMDVAGISIGGGREIENEYRKSRKKRFTENS
ncbi:MAG: hypothetical protein ACI4EV_02670 [Lachnospiraceae bacterium]